MARRIVRSSTQNTRQTAQRTPRPKASGSQVIVLVVLGFVGALLLFLITGAAANRRIDRQVIIESSQASLTPDAGLTASNTLAAPTPVPTAQRPAGPYVGIVAGHWGNDSGAECPDGVTEQQTNLTIATLVTQKLRAKGIWTDLLQEFDSRLNGYHADVLISIHADSCHPIDADPPASGFKVARSVANAIPTTEDRLVTCLKTEYQKVTKMRFHENSITPDMTSYHSFAEVDPDTPAAIIETGFLYLDYDIIVKQPDLPATGIANGIECFLHSNGD